MSKATRERWAQQQSLPVESKVVALRGPQFKAWIESMIAQARDAADPIGVWVNVGPEEAEVLLSFSRGNRKRRRVVS